MQRKIGALRLGLTFAGCFLGAGYVSGQELWQYFGAFGTHGLLGLVLAIALLGGTGVLLLRLSARTGIEAMDALIVRADIPWLRTAVGVLTAALLFGVVCIMAAGIGALGEQMLGLPVWLGAAIACVLIAAAAYFGLGGMVSVFTVAVPCMIVAALVKTITLRPKMNRFIANKNFYQRNGVSASFVVKKQFADEAAEAAAATLAGEGTEAPDFTVEMIDGSKVALSELRGKVVLLNFWATWCTPCVAELPYFAELYAEYGDEISLVAIHSNLVTDDVDKFLAKENLDMPFALDKTGAVIKSLGGSTQLPMTVIVDADGKIVYNKVGSVTLTVLEGLVAPLLAE